MSTIAELTIPTGEFALRETLESLPTVSVEVERVVAYDPERVMPCVWFAGDETEIEQLEETLEADESIEEVKLLTDLGDERLYRMDWVRDVTVIVHILTEEEATILHARGARSQWEFRILFPERKALSRTYDFATDRGLTITMEKIHELEDNRHSRYGLTEPQYETLVEALRRGYYQIPREMDMESLATELDISHQALSERLRRAHRALVEDAIELGPENEDR